MSEKEIFEANLELSTEFSRYLLSRPDVAQKIPADAEVIFLLETNPELSAYNLGLASKIQEAGETVIFVKIEGLRPAFESRLIEPHLEHSA
ncbi:MAG: hypothetical protein HQL23_09810 [Candidatus Omnitrophica bacterium]|nr:hypothetical protein [Candidatus Omnitrophota bacterium]